jgi:hypothetical protein
MFFHQKNHGHHGHEQQNNDKKHVDINVKVSVNNVPSFKFEMGNAEIPKDMANAFQKQNG